MKSIPITRLEATLVLGAGRTDLTDLGTTSGLHVVAPRMPARRKVTLEEFEADMREASKTASTAR